MGLQENCCQLLLCTVSLACLLGFLALPPKFILNSNTLFIQPTGFSLLFLKVGCGWVSMCSCCSLSRAYLLKFTLLQSRFLFSSDIATFMLPVFNIGLEFLQNSRKKLKKKNFKTKYLLCFVHQCNILSNCRKRSNF